MSDEFLSTEVTKKLYTVPMLASRNISIALLFRLYFSFIFELQYFNLWTVDNFSTVI